MTLPRVGLGCMRLSTEGLDEDVAVAVIRAAVEAGVTLFDTATAYCRHDELGENERLLARALGAQLAASIIVTKGGLRRPGGAWRPDGRASSILEDAERSAEALGRPPDVFLLHAPDPSVPWKTSMRALAAVHERGLAKGVGLSNVSVGQLNEARELAPITVVQQSLSIFDDRARRSGVLRQALDLGLDVMAHSPLGGPKRAPKLAKEAVLDVLANGLGVSHAAVALAAVLDVSPQVSVIPGARRVDTIRDAARALTVRFPPEAKAVLEHHYPALSAPAAVVPSASSSRAEVVLVMGIQGAGKSRLVAQFVDDGYARFNRDDLGGTLKDVANAMARSLADGTTHAVLDNTYTTRAARSMVIELAKKHGAKVRGVWLEVPLHEAQVNVINRMLAQHGRLLGPSELKAQRDNTGLSPLVHFRTVRELEPPTEAEGFDRLEVRPFTRIAVERPAGRFIALERAADFEPTDQPTFVFAWTEDETSARAAASRLGATALVCPHGGGPPQCWCRPPLPGLLLEACHRHGLSPSASVVHVASEAHRVMAAAVGARTD